MTVCLLDMCFFFYFLVKFSGSDRKIKNIKNKNIKKREEEKKSQVVEIRFLVQKIKNRKIWS